MRALAQIMAVKKAKDIRVPLDEVVRLDRRARFGEENYFPGEFNRKPMKYCTPESPCYNFRDTSMWGMLAGGTREVCPVCDQVAEEVAEFLRDFPGWLTTREGRFETWCAETVRKATAAGNTPPKNEDSKEPPSFD